MLDEGDCRLCGRPDGEGHEASDPCGIVANLLNLEGPAGGARGCNQANQGTPQSTGTYSGRLELSARLADCANVLTSLSVPEDHPSVLLSRYRYQQCVDLLHEAAFATSGMAMLGQRQRTVRETIESLAKSGWLTEDEAVGILATLPRPESGS